MMRCMQDTGEAMILAHQGQAQLAEMLRATLARLWVRGLGRFARLAGRATGSRPYTG